MRDALPEWSLTPLVQALQAMRGVQLIAAMTLLGELQDFLRFDNPRQLMAYVGLVPGEHSSGPKRRQGSITKAGNRVARRMLVEVAWHYQHSPRAGGLRLGHRLRGADLWLARHQARASECGCELSNTEAMRRRR